MNFKVKREQKIRKLIYDLRKKKYKVNRFSIFYLRNEIILGILGIMEILIFIRDSFSHSFYDLLLALAIMGFIFAFLNSYRYLFYFFKNKSRFDGFGCMLGIYDLDKKVYLKKKEILLINLSEMFLLAVTALISYHYFLGVSLFGIFLFVLDMIEYIELKGRMKKKQVIMPVMFYKTYLIIEGAFYE